MAASPPQSGHMTARHYTGTQAHCLFYCVDVDTHIVQISRSYKLLMQCDGISITGHFVTSITRCRDCGGDHCSWPGQCHELLLRSAPMSMV